LGKLRRVEAAEDLLYDRGFRVVRVRLDRGRARVEVGDAELARLHALWEELDEELRALGFDDAVMDPRGYRSGGADLPLAPRPNRGSSAGVEAGSG
jgi:PP-loop superfamily ATP-utilizing enzyme